MYIVQNNILIKWKKKNISNSLNMFTYMSCIKIYIMFKNECRTIELTFRSTNHIASCPLYLFINLFNKIHLHKILPGRVCLHQNHRLSTLLLKRISFKPEIIDRAHKKAAFIHIKKKKKKKYKKEFKFFGFSCSA